ncbi:glycosyltransferase family 1 protein [Nakamurella sp. PAMC28650]|uniref:glycosyltransferase family 4 protein n=1 Tax=Nakamurella sp. PAMC28650 TaxID=2762325 RepID=UPI00164DBAEB|nr:glycosyltransferase family 1 protein [Nakamurella sp. PAMC28650]QNK83175.1 glycosyltransferase family 4 protein [Nakamurella sp. PAMC28650]
MGVVSVILEQSLAPVPGGTGRYARQLAEALVPLAPPGWSVRSITAWHRDVGPARAPGVVGPHRLWLGHRGLTAAWERGAPPWPGGDVVHATTPLAPRRRRAPLVVTVHDAVPWTHPETLTPRGVAWHRKTIETAARTADAIIVPSAATAEELSRFVSLGDRVHVIPMAATVLEVPADAARRRASLGLPPRYLMSLATLEPRKGLDVLLAALGRLGADAPPLAVVGQTGWGGVAPEAIAHAEGVPGDALHVLGRIGDDDLAAVLAGADAMVVPSRVEGFGMPVAEAMAAGVPVIHSDAAALVEVAGGAGLTVPVGSAAALADAIATLWRDPLLAGRLEASGRVRAAGYTWSATAASTWDLYRSLR